MYYYYYLLFFKKNCLGTKLRGDFEEKFKNVLRDINRAQGEIILFIDEIHMLVGKS